jgi:hypothetical protein
MLISCVLLCSIMLVSCVLMCSIRRNAFLRFSSELEVITDDYCVTNCKGCGRRQSWINFRYCPVMFPEVLNKTHENL